MIVSLYKCTSDNIMCGESPCYTCSEYGTVIQCNIYSCWRLHFSMNIMKCFFKLRLMCNYSVLLHANLLNHSTYTTQHTCQFLLCMCMAINQLVDYTCQSDNCYNWRTYQDIMQVAYNDEAHDILICPVNCNNCSDSCRYNWNINLCIIMCM